MFAFGWVVLAIVVGAVASSIGRGFWSYFLISLFFSPLIGFVILAIQGKATQEEILREKRHIFYCKKCGDAYGGKGTDLRQCPSCNNMLMETNVLVEDWRRYPEEKKNSLKKAFSEGRFSLNTVATQVTVQSSSVDELKKYKELLDMGAISQEEFEAKKKQLLRL